MSGTLHPIWQRYWIISWWFERIYLLLLELKKSRLFFGNRWHIIEKCDSEFRKTNLCLKCKLLWEWERETLSTVIDEDGANGKFKLLKILTNQSIIIGHRFVKHLQVCNSNFELTPRLSECTRESKRLENRFCRKNYFRISCIFFIIVLKFCLHSFLKSKLLKKFLDTKIIYGIIWTLESVPAAQRIAGFLEFCYLAKIHLKNYEILPN